MRHCCRITGQVILRCNRNRGGPTSRFHWNCTSL